MDKIFNLESKNMRDLRSRLAKEGVLDIAFSETASIGQVKNALDILAKNKDWIDGIVKEKEKRNT